MDLQVVHAEAAGIAALNNEMSTIACLSYRWLVLAIAMMRFYIQKGTCKGLYRSIARTLKFFQTFALVEVRFEVEFAVICT